MAESVHVAVDLGAGSGRVMLGRLADGRLTLHEAHRFEHEALPTPAGLCWDLTGLWRNILLGLRQAATLAEAHGWRIESVGVDTWGVDFAVVSTDGELCGLPRAYRDPAFDEHFIAVRSQLGDRVLYESTGIQLMPFNSLYQYHARAAALTSMSSEGQILFMPDLFHWLLSGQRSCERTIASTSQMVDARTGDWNRQLVKKLGLSTDLLGPLSDPGTVLGPLTAAVAQATGLSESVQVVLPPSHDTAAAVAGVPADAGTSWAYLSSGTWSLLGAELQQAQINDATFAANFTHELGVAGSIRFLKNIAGLWLVQETRRQLQREGQEISFAEMTEQAAGAAPMRTLLPVNDPAFAAPGRMIDRIRDYARQSGQPVPESVGQVVRACLESLALTYRATFGQMENLLDRRFDVLHIVGGGGKNGLLNRMTAHATGRTLEIGPYEATASGNLLMQAMGLGHLATLADVRQVVRHSFPPQRIEEAADPAWADAAKRFAELPAMIVSE